MKNVNPIHLQLLRISCLMWCLLTWPAVTFAQEGYFRVSPGPLNAGHAAYDNSDGCPKCHEPNHGVTNRKCLSCHETMLHAGGLHVTLGKRPCTSCHVEHKGRAFSIIDWQTVGGRDAFNHTVTDFSLTEHHAQVSCPRCHTRHLKTGRSSYLGLSTKCQSCHANAHHFRRQELANNCNLCHQPGQSMRGQTLRSWATQHLKFSKVQLQGRHNERVCIDCHKDAKMGERAAPRQCIDCHTPVHPVSEKSKNCLDCHDQNAAFKGTRFDHGKLGFALKGRHARTTCAGCHLRNAKTGPGKVVSSACASCHVPVHPVVKATADCATCHKDVESFKGAHIDHSQFRFALHGTHEQMTCAKCHQRRRGVVEEPSKAKSEYRQGDCTSCHQHRDAHQGQFKNRRCSDCHMEGGTRNSPFNHDLDTRFALIGFHGDARVRNDCVLCHTGRVYHTNTLRCADCHYDEHRGQLGKDCTKCHSPFSPFDKPHMDDFVHQDFPLEGKHRTIACRKCHGSHDYKMDKHRCIDCHAKDDKHQGKLGQDCAKCHRPEKGAPKFDHNSMTNFKKTGIHQKVACILCHRARVAQSHALSIGDWSRVVVTPLDRTFPVWGHRCFECHQDPHQGRYGVDCETCHTTDSFKIRHTGAANATRLLDRLGNWLKQEAVDVGKSTRPLDHKGDWLRQHAVIAGYERDLAEEKRTCGSCHGTPGCDNCHRTKAPRSHTALFRVRTHGQIAGFAPEACGTCHRVASCIQCHRRTPPRNHRGNWRTLHGYASGGFADSNCFVCHRRADCAVCHHH